MSKKYIRTLNSLTKDKSKFDILKDELTTLRLQEATTKRVKKRSVILKRAKRRKKYENLLDVKFDGYHSALEANLPKSEQWFRDLYSKELIERKLKTKLHLDKYNTPVNRKYIPDVHNRGYKYVIEIDGSWHDQPEVQYKDRQKDYYFEKRGYCVIRIKAFNEESYKAGITQLKEHILKIEG